MSGRPLKARDQHHFDVCLRCQAEAAKYRLILRTLREMRDSPETAPRGLVLRVMAGISRPLTEPRRGLERVISGLSASLGLRQQHRWSRNRKGLRRRAWRLERIHAARATSHRKGPPTAEASESPIRGRGRQRG